jgi:hypothetical protein
MVSLVSLLGYFFCIIAISTVAAGAMIGLINISEAERVDHYRHPRPAVERNDKEVRVLHKANHRSPAKDTIAMHRDKKSYLKRGTNDCVISLRRCRHDP